MRAIKTANTDIALGAPSDWDQEQLPCDALWVECTAVQYIPVVNSFWVPNEDELDWLRSGAAIKLSIIGNTMPPVCVSVCFDKETF
jgi:hypothetical protein